MTPSPPPTPSPTPEKRTTEDQARHLRLIVRDLRTMGDIQLVRFTEDNIVPHNISLADELWLIAAALDPDRMFDHLNPDNPDV